MLFKKQNGFSLVSALVALGILGVSAKMLMTLNLQTVKSQKRTETFQNAFSLETRMAITLMDSNLCKAALTDNGNSPIIVNNKDISIFDRNGDPIYEVRPEPYFNNTIKINSIKMINLDLPAPVNGFRYGQADIEVKYEKIAKVLDQNGQEYTKTLGAPISIKTLADGTLENCYSEEDNAVATAVERICNDLGGEVNANGECELIPGQPVPTNDNTPTSTLLDDVYVNRVGDNVSGPLTLNPGAPLNTQDSLIADGTIEANAAINANARINANDGIDLALGKIICTQIDASGNKHCVDLSKKCPANTIFSGQYHQSGSNLGAPKCVLPCSNTEHFAGFNPEGTAAICRPLPFSTCGEGQYAISVDANGNTDCAPVPESAQGSCPDGHYLAGFEPDGTKICKPDTTVDQGCTPPQVLQGFNSQGEAVCTTPPSVSGVEVQEFKLGNTWSEPGSNQSAGDSTVVAQDYDFCFLSAMAGEDGYKDSSYRECRVSRSGSTWRLTSNHDESRSVMCAMQCINICSGPQEGYWSTTSVGQCQCPQGSVQGTQSVNQECRGAKCGGSCDPANKVTSRSCFCSTPCQAPNVICPQIGNNVCVPASACPGGGLDPGIQ